MKRITSAAVLAVPLAALVFARDALAVPPPIPGAPVIAGVPAPQPSAPILFLTRSEALAHLGRVAAWDKGMQATACVDPDAGIDAGQELCRFGGIIEVESGPGNNIVESDNTQEAVFTWSFHRSLTMAATYKPQEDNAFEYLATHPGYLEWRDGNGTGPNSYSIYNCGWGVRAVLEYEAATGDMSRHAYGDTCAMHIYDNAGVTVNGTLIDAATSGWAAAGLWMWGDATSQATMKAKASAIGGLVKAWIDQTPSRVASRTWAVTGGAAFYGVMGSYMKDHPAEQASWVATIAPQLAGYVDSSQPVGANDWTDWRNAHSAWNMLAQFTAADAIGGSDGDMHRQIALDALTKLVAQDTDNDGAIPGSQQRPATEDQSWITAYLVYFGLRPVLTAADVGDAGASDASAAVDAAVANDAGIDGGGNGATGGGSSSSGCGCTVAGVDGSAWGAIGSALVVVGAGLRRRRRHAR